jgi:hypothetical protein
MNEAQYSFVSLDLAYRLLDYCWPEILLAAGPSLSS